MPKISVIIPVYNTEKFLKRCLESVCNQTLKNIEIICINDCSTDGSAKILKEYEEKYKNLSVINLEKNNGASNSRNIGISLANGEFLAFVDSDDEIDLNFYEKLYEKAQKNKSDIVKGQATEISYDGKRTIIKQIPESSKWYFLSYWLLAIYRRSFILKNNISFSQEHVIGEDLLFLFQALMATNNLCLVNDAFYYYHRREDSADSKTLLPDKIKSALHVNDLITDSINLNITANDPIYGFIFHHFIMRCFNLSLRNEETSQKSLCAKTAINIFNKCKNRESLEIIFLKTAPHLFSLLDNNDFDGIRSLLTNCKSPIELVLSGLRAKIKKL